MPTPPPVHTPLPAAPASAAEAIEQVFLSPRVLDQRAFSDFSSTLRALIDQAAGQADSLRSAAESARGTLMELSRADESQKTGIDLCAKALAGIDHRSARVQALLQQAEAVAAAFSEFDAESTRLTDRKLDALTARLESLADAATARAEAAERRLEQAAAEYEHRAAAAQQELDSSITLLHDLVQLAASHTGRSLPTDGGRGAGATSGLESTTPGTLADFVRRAERLREEAAFAARQLDSVRVQTEQARDSLGTSLDAAGRILEQAANQQQTLQTSLADAVRQSRALAQSLDQRAVELRRSVDQAVADATPRADAAASSLRSAIADAEESVRGSSTLLQAVDTATGQLRSLLAQLEPWQGILLGRASRDLPAPIKEIVQNFRGDLARDLGALAAAFRSIATRAETAIEDAALGPIGFPPPPVHSAPAPVAPVLAPPPLSSNAAPSQTLKPAPEPSPNLDPAQPAAPPKVVTTRAAGKSRFAGLTTAVRSSSPPAQP